MYQRWRIASLVLSAQSMQRVHVTPVFSLIQKMIFFQISYQCYSTDVKRAHQENLLFFHLITSFDTKSSGRYQTRLNQNNRMNLQNYRSNVIQNKVKIKFIKLQSSGAWNPSGVQTNPESILILQSIKSHRIYRMLNNNCVENEHS